MGRPRHLESGTAGREAAPACPRRQAPPPHPTLCSCRLPQVARLTCEKHDAGMRAATTPHSLLLPPAAGGAADSREARRRHACRLHTPLFAAAACRSCRLPQVARLTREKHDAGMRAANAEAAAATAAVYSQHHHGPALMHPFTCPPPEPKVWRVCGVWTHRSRGAFADACVDAPTARAQSVARACSAD
eukprot:363536-Chlamydomonas_euryale.AAC.1